MIAWLRLHTEFALAIDLLRAKKRVGQTQNSLEKVFRDFSQLSNAGQREKDRHFGRRDYHTGTLMASPRGFPAVALRPASPQTDSLPQTIPIPPELYEQESQVLWILFVLANLPAKLADECLATD